MANQFEEAVGKLLTMIGEDPARDGLRDTPARVVKSLCELSRGYDEDPAEILSRTFEQGEDERAPVYGGVIVLRDIELYSLCEHHMLPFVGRAYVAYAPGEDSRIVGISKLARLVDCFARRLQVQERLTAQIADAIETHLKPRGVFVQIEADHFCMRMRGVGKQNSTMVTFEARGIFEEGARPRAEVLALTMPRSA